MRIASLALFAAVVAASHSPAAAQSTADEIAAILARDAAPCWKLRSRNPQEDTVVIDILVEKGGVIRENGTPVNATGNKMAGLTAGLALGGCSPYDIDPEFTGIVRVTMTPGN